MSLIRFNGAPKAKMQYQEELDFAKQVGIKFFRVVHKSSPIESARCTFGPQPVAITYRSANGRRTIHYEGLKDATGGDSPAQCWFVPDALGIAWADIPDLPYNRKVLAAGLYNAPWWLAGDPAGGELANASVTDEDRANFAAIKELSNELGVTPVQERPALVVLGETVKSLEEQLEEMRQENERLRQQQQPIVQQAKQAAAPVGTVALRAEITRQVHEKYADLLADIKVKYGKQWANSTEYKEQILKKINERLENGNDHLATRNAS